MLDEMGNKLINQE